jgi:hypothetical protein
VTCLMWTVGWIRFFPPNCIESPVAASLGASPSSSSLFLLVHLELSPIHLKQPKNTIVEDR